MKPLTRALHPSNQPAIRRGVTTRKSSEGAKRETCRENCIGQFNITINSIAPGAIETPINTKLLNDPQKLSALLTQIPLARLGKPYDVAGLAVFLLTFVNDAGETFAPSEE